MITPLQSLPNGVCKYSISKKEDLDKINKNAISPTSTAMLVDENGLTIYMLNGDKTDWVKL